MTEVRIGKFEVVRRLGRGGMGTVYEGYDGALDRRVAIKTLTAESLSDEDSRRRFEREARAAARLQHPNIVTIHELGNFGGQGRPYIVMEYLEGTDLSALIDKKMPIPLTAALGIAAELCRALDYAHQKAVVHRDVKPSNIRYLDDDRIKIMDFGIARMEGTGQITRSGVLVGTLHYMSPEQIQGKKVDGRSDIFSAGCILYEMLAGRRPFEGQSATTILFKIVHEPAPPILIANSNLPEQAQEILNRALAKTPDDRFQTAREMARELERLREIVQRTSPRLSHEAQCRLDEAENLRRKRKWSELVPLAERILSERPDSKAAWCAYHQAKNELHRLKEEMHFDPVAKTRQMMEIKREIQLLSPIPETRDQIQPAPTRRRETEEAEAKKSQTIPATEVARQSPSSSRPTWVASFALILAVAVGIGWLVLRPSPPPEPFSQTVFIASEPSGSDVFVNGTHQGLVTRDGGFVELPLEGKEGETFSIELRKEGYLSASTTVRLSSNPLSPIQLSLEPVLKAWVIQTEPGGATIELDGERLDDTTPLEIALSPREEHSVVVSKDGYVSRSFTLEPQEGFPTDPIVLVAKVVESTEASAEQPEAETESPPLESEDSSEAAAEPMTAEPEEKDAAVESVAPPAPQPMVEEPHISEETVAPGVEPPEESTPPPSALFGTLSVHSEYPLSVLSGGDALVEMSRDPTVKLQTGRQPIILLAPEVFLNQTASVEIRLGDTTHFYAPQLGTASIRSFPENGMLTIDGIRAKDLPIIDLPIAAGTHTFLFQWPNGRRSEQTVDVKAGERVYVTGQIR